MRFKITPTGKVAAAWLSRKFLFWIYIPYQVIDFIVGKIGWLGVFTSPEDLQTALDRAPTWVAVVTEFISYYFSVALSWLWAGATLATSYEALVALLAVIMLLLMIDVDSFVRRLSFWKFKVMSIVADTIWISEDAAANIIRESDWGKLHSPYVFHTTNIFDDLTRGLAASTSKTVVQHGMADKDKAMLRFKIYVRKILNSFASENPNYSRDADGKREFDEGAVRALADHLLDSDIAKEFGGLPDTRL